MIALKNLFAPLEKLEKCFIELRGQSEAFVDGCVKLLVYGREEIDLAVIGGKRIRICGASLTLSYLSEEKIAISGEINGVRYLEDV